jgi:hypothetical protein
MIGIYSMQEEKNLYFGSRISKEDRPVFWETGWINIRVKLSLRLINCAPSHKEIRWDVGVRGTDRAIRLTGREGP